MAHSPAHTAPAGTERKHGPGGGQDAPEALPPQWLEREMFYKLLLLECGGNALLVSQSSCLPPIVGSKGAGES